MNAAIQKGLISSADLSIICFALVNEQNQIKQLGNTQKASKQTYSKN